ncbi:MAG: intradiol ring-cleavage dioxygenase [Cyanobacteria bacterium P01_F01_bin.116]
MPKLRLSRRTILRMGPATLASFAAVTCSRSHRLFTAKQSVQSLSPTPACGDDPTTPSQTEGPFYTPNSPQRKSLLESGLPGNPIVVIGQVLSSECRPIAGALVDFWHTNAQGDYDNIGYSFRGHQFTDADGRYRIETIVPGIYPGRTRHFHVKVQAPNQPVLTTQLYFPEEPANQGDFLFNPALLMSVSNNNDVKEASFNFVLETGA